MMVLLGMDVFNAHGRGPRHPTSHWICIFTDNCLLFHTIGSLKPNKSYSFPSYHTQMTITTQTVQVKTSQSISLQTQIHSQEETTLCQTTANHNPGSSYICPPIHLEG